MMNMIKGAFNDFVNIIRAFEDIIDIPTALYLRIFPGHTHFVFFASFLWSMLEDSININNCNWNPVVLKKNVLKPLKITFFYHYPTFTIMGSPWVMPKTKFIFAEITKSDNKLSKTFYFIKISYVLTEVLFFYFVWCFFAKNSVVQVARNSSDQDGEAGLTKSKKHYLSQVIFINFMK